MEHTTGCLKKADHHASAYEPHSVWTHAPARHLWKNCRCPGTSMSDWRIMAAAPTCKSLATLRGAKAMAMDSIGCRALPPIHTRKYGVAHMRFGGLWWCSTRSCSHGPM